MFEKKSHFQQKKILQKQALEELQYFALQALFSAASIFLIIL